MSVLGARSGDENEKGLGDAATLRKARDDVSHDVR